jgi:hypothetical protein
MAGMKDMNDRTLDQLLSAWMDLGPTSAPDRVADAARLEARTMRQTAIPPWWPPRRFLELNNALRVGLVAAAVVAAALIGYTYFIAPTVGTDPPAPIPTPTATSSPASSPTAEAVPALVPGTGRLSPGPYLITDIGPLEITIRVPNGWESNVVPAMVWSTENEKATVAYMTTTDLFADPCDPEQGLAGVGPTAADLVAALATVPGLAVDSQSDVTIAGYPGTRLDFIATDPPCEEGVEALLLRSEPGSVDRPHPGGDTVLSSIVVLDVEGTRLVISARVPTEANAGRSAEVEQIIGSTIVEVP